MCDDPDVYPRAERTIFQSKDALVISNSHHGYRIDSEIARNSRGDIVFKAQHFNRTSGIVDEESLVIKALKNQSPYSCASTKCTAMLRVQNNPHVISVQRVFCDVEFTYILLPHLAGGDLFEFVYENGDGLPERVAVQYLRDMVRGLCAMKEQRFAHGDVSLENAMFLTNERDGIQLIDLGSSILVPQDAVGRRITIPLSSRCTKHPYLAPEVVVCDAYDPFAADVWSVGVCLYMMLTAKPLYSHYNDISFELLLHEGGLTQKL